MLDPLTNFLKLGLPCLGIGLVLLLLLQILPRWKAESDARRAIYRGYSFLFVLVGGLFVLLGLVAEFALPHRSKAPVVLSMVPAIAFFFGVGWMKYREGRLVKGQQRVPE